MRRFSLVLTALFVLPMLLSAAQAQGAPRAAPANDNFAGATPIMIGKSYSVTNIHEATSEGGQPATVSCGISPTIHYSVWYSFSLAYGGTVFLSTSGSNFRHDVIDSLDTKIAVYSGASLGALSQEACNDDNTTLAGELTFTAAPATTYYVLVGAVNITAPLPGSVLRLSSRMLAHLYYADNYNFENPFASADWKIKNGSGDDRLCGDGTYTPVIGSCAFRFVGNAGEASKLKQTLAYPTEFTPRKGAILRFIVFYRIQDAALGNAKIKFKAAYSDGTPTTIGAVNLTGEPTMAVYAMANRNFALASKAVASVTFQVDFKSTTGVLMIDYAYMYYYASVTTRDGALPVPLAAAPTKR